MGAHDQIYLVEWESKYKFLSKGPSDYKAKCNDCDCVFSIKSGGDADVKRHIRSKKHRSNCDSSASTSSSVHTSVIDDGADADENNNVTLSPEEEVTKAEVLQALKVVSSNYSFNSTTDDGDRLRLMFPNDPIAKKYQQSKTKVNYSIKHGIAPYIQELNIEDLKG